MYRSGKNHPTVTCSFCGKPAERVEKMITLSIFAEASKYDVLRFINKTRSAREVAKTIRRSLWMVL